MNKDLLRQVIVSATEKLIKNLDEVIAVNDNNDKEFDFKLSGNDTTYGRETRLDVVDSSGTVVWKLVIEDKTVKLPNIDPTISEFK